VSPAGKADRRILGSGLRRDQRDRHAHSHLGLGKLYRRTGKQQEAKEHLTTATTMYREMDMRFWLEQAKAVTIDPVGGV
jgi:hypothetical protein